MQGLTVGMVKSDHLIRSPCNGVRTQPIMSDVQTMPMPSAPAGRLVRIVQRYPSAIAWWSSVTTVATIVLSFR